MSFVRRSFAAVSGLFLLQLTLLGSGTLCAPHHPAMQNGEAMSTMRQTMDAGRQMPADAGMAVNADDNGAPMSPADCNGSGQEHDGCRLPYAPGQCSSMTTCNITASPAAMIASANSLRTVALEYTSPTLAHAGPTFAPELPPPRA
jgi:hypothetical protein